MTRIVTLSDGRNMAYEEYGDPEGTPVLSFHGCPSSRLDAAPAHPAALSLGVRLISPDRPGIGRSTYQPHRRLLDWPDDVAQLTEALGIERFAVMGWSSGGPYAAVCAAGMRERVTKLALLSSAVPLDFYGTKRGLTSDDRILLFLVHWAPRLASALMRVTIADASDALLLREVNRSFPAVDRAVLGERGSPTDPLVILREAMRQGTRGCLQDYRIFGDPWGFSLGEISVPVHIWEGAEDQTGPPEYRAFLKREIPHASVTVVPGEGHLSLLPHQAPAILKELLS